MQRLKRRGNSLFLICFTIVVAFFSNLVQGAEGPVYKGVRPLKEVVETSDEIKKESNKEQGEEAYRYDPSGKTDPFKSFIAIQEEQKEKERRKPKTYLETLELSQLELVMIAVGSKGKWAMVRDSKGLGHVIKVGTAIGTNGGEVYKIERGQVVVREEYKDFRGQKQYREIVKKTTSLQ